MIEKVEHITQKQITALDKFLTLLKKHGALGVMTVWLFLSQKDFNTRISSLETKLFSCLGDKSVLSFTQGTQKIPIENPPKNYAIIPGRIKTINYDNERRA